MFRIVHQLAYRCVRNRGCAIQNDTDKRQRNKRKVPRQYDDQTDPQRGGNFGDGDRFNRAETFVHDATCELAQHATKERHHDGGTGPQRG